MLLIRLLLLHQMMLLQIKIMLLQQMMLMQIRLMLPGQMMLLQIRVMWLQQKMLLKIKMLLLRQMILFPIIFILLKTMKSQVYCFVFFEGLSRFDFMQLANYVNVCAVWQHNLINCTNKRIRKLDFRRVVNSVFIWVISIIIKTQEQQ